MASQPTEDNTPETAVLEGTPDQPVKETNRLTSLDFVRGVAVLGILFANIVAFGQPFIAYIWPPALVGGNDAADNLTWLVQFVLVDGKFRGLFSLLFGAGLFLFMERAWARGSGRGLQMRRLFWLLLFGVSHFFLIWIGDILSLYAVWGMVALTMMKWRAKSQMVTGVILLWLGALFMVGAMGSQYVMGVGTEPMAGVPAEAIEEIRALPTTKLDMSAEAAELYGEASYPEIVEETVTTRWSWWLKQVLFVGPTETLAWILIGMAYYRRGLFSGEYDNAKLKRRGWLWFGLGSVLALVIGWWPYSTGFEMFATMLSFNGLGRLAQIPQVFGLLFLLVAYAPAAVKTGIGQRFVAAGRVAFTNYLGTSVVMMFIFHGWALGLYGELGRPELALVVFATWAFMLWWSKWWLERYRYGPLEWLWRCLTYGRRFPIKRDAA
ncbi:DUF418 domain-containing protein [Paraurantiacibacter namhicola]|uniref:DUF418 domain-containing protein n=1 Tax=Paraurantiacibacter namhicola TaxID=645517 RepID=A0A1C7DBL9_9SPHN|nr:DUF418 domain-containing protein [Paraurantiacibacter namhicola]ANU08673.1 hypothetical protein A6F65_02391 [Paraurantiacibacter namhicola]